MGDICLTERAVLEVSDISQQEHELSGVCEHRGQQVRLCHWTPGRMDEHRDTAQAQPRLPDPHRWHCLGCLTKICANPSTVISPLCPQPQGRVWSASSGCDYQGLVNSNFTHFTLKCSAWAGIQAPAGVRRGRVTFPGNIPSFPEKARCTGCFSRACFPL